MSTLNGQSNTSSGSGGYESTAAPAESAQGVYSRLDRILVELVETHEAMLKVVTEHRTALSRADLRAIDACITRHSELVQGVARLEQERSAIAKVLVGEKRLHGRSSGERSRNHVREQGDVRLAEMVADAPEAVRGRLGGLGAVLKDLLLRLSTEQRALKQAAEALGTHMDGIMRQVYRGLSHAGTYARSGRVDAGVQVVSTLDVNS